MAARFVRVQNKFVRVDAIAYVDFLESGRAMVHIQGLTQEKQNIPVEPDEARKLRAFFEAEAGAMSSGPGGAGPLPMMEKTGWGR